MKICKECGERSDTNHCPNCGRIVPMSAATPDLLDVLDQVLSNKNVVFI